MKKRDPWNYHTELESIHGGYRNQARNVRDAVEGLDESEYGVHLVENAAVTSYWTSATARQGMLNAMWMGHLHERLCTLRNLQAAQLAVMVMILWRLL